MKELVENLNESKSILINQLPLVLLYSSKNNSSITIFLSKDVVSISAIEPLVGMCVAFESELLRE